MQGVDSGAGSAVTAPNVPDPKNVGKNLQRFIVEIDSIVSQFYNNLGE